MDEAINHACQEAVGARFADGAARVALRGRTGTGLSAVVVEMLVAKSQEGRVLIIAPGVTHRQIRTDLARVAPDIRVGEFGGDTDIEITTAFRADIYQDRKPGDAYSFIVAEECWPNEAQRLRNAVAHFHTAKVLEVVRMPEPHRPNLDCDAVVDLEEVMASMAAPSP